MKFKDKNVFITGGTKGLGKALALCFAKEGARVAVNYRSDKDSADQTRTELAVLTEHVLVEQADVSSASDVDALFKQVISRWGSVDILVNNAGLVRDKLLLYLNEADWDAVVDTNLKGTYLCSRAVLKPMIGNRFGRIINMVSPSALTGRAGQTNYSASKGGMISFTKSLAREVARLGITVNAVCPGVIKTAMSETLTPEAEKELMRMIPVGRFGEPAHVASAILFLASAEAEYITGQVLAVDGGLT
ncbi:MAG: 3-oxoacyl-ACP reductase family protein [Desulfobacterales bacterium]|nr:3-oxoacyl-ACP reductase family protein [Desulfobacterales bacterium]